MSALRLHLTAAEHRLIDRENRQSSAHAAGERTDELLDRIADLEDRLYVRGALLESAVELLNRRAVELASLRSLIRMDVAMKAMDSDTATPRLELAA